MFVIASLCGVFVGLVQGLIGGGGSVLGAPLLIYVVGLKRSARRHRHERAGRGDFRARQPAGLCALRPRLNRNDASLGDPFAMGREAPGKFHEWPLNATVADVGDD